MQYRMVNGEVLCRVWWRLLCPSHSHKYLSFSRVILNHHHSQKCTCVVLWPAEEWECKCNQFSRRECVWAVVVGKENSRQVKMEMKMLSVELFYVIWHNCVFTRAQELSLKSVQNLSSILIIFWGLFVVVQCSIYTMMKFNG